MKSAHPAILCIVVAEEALRTRIDRDVPQMHIEDHDPLDRLQEAARGYRNTRTWPRVQAIILAKQGDSAAQIARALGVSRRAVQAWVTAYNRGGLEALPDRPHPGRTPILPRDQEARFLERIDAPPRPEDGVCELRGADIRRILEQEFAARYTLDGVYKLLHRLGYSDLMPRPQHPESCPEAQEFFKEIVVEHIAAIAEQHPEAEGRGLAPGRGPVRPEGLAHPGLGAARLAAPPGAPGRPGVAVRAHGGVRRQRGGGGAGDAGVEHGGGQPVPGGVLPAAGPRGPWRAAVGQRGVPHGRGPGGAGEREPDRAAAVLAGVEPGGEPVALPAVASLVPPGVPGLRGAARRGGGGLEGRLPGPGEDPDDLAAPYLNEDR